MRYIPTASALCICLWAIVAVSPGSASPCGLHRIAHRRSFSAPPPSTSEPLSDWISTAYNGLNHIRTTATINNTPLRLRAILNSVAQSRADALCSNKDTYAIADTDAQTLVQQVAKVNTDSAEVLSARDISSVEDTLSAWGKGTPSKNAQLSAIIWSGYQYVGFGACKDTLVAVVTGEFI
ncbi:hypothetical protein GGI07_005337 [Coemansia sp. Benny D115]|nr:hypothetical protein GGI07_005337 [Coemansia sp. Benny D115]